MNRIAHKLNQQVSVLGATYLLIGLTKLDGEWFALLLDGSGHAVDVRCAWVDCF
jgi:hypothetical protein